jgi:aquaporin Z
MSSSLFRKATAEAIGTFWLVFVGVGSAVFAGQAIGLVGIAFAFGIGMLIMAYVVGPISGAHLNPAVSVGLFTAGRMSAADLLAYIASQVGGAIVAALMVLLIARGRPSGYNAAVWGLGANGFGAHSPAGYHLAACFAAEAFLTFMFVLVVVAATSRRSPAALAGITIGLALAAAHLVSLPITNTSVNPARSTGPALFVGGWATGQLWLFWIAPLLGGFVAGLVARLLDLDKAAAPQPLFEEPSLHETFRVPPPTVAWPRGSR